MDELTAATKPAPTAPGAGSRNAPPTPWKGPPPVIPAPVSRCPRGALVSVEGINGVGKTYLTGRVVELLDDEPLNLDGFSRQHHGRSGLGGGLLRALYAASAGDPFLRGGTPMAEALLLLAIKRHDLDLIIPALSAGRAVVEGRSVDTTAVCHGLLWHPKEPDAALKTALALLHLASAFRPLPDLTILVTDDVAHAVNRAQIRDARTFTPEETRFMRDACALHEQLAASDPARYRILDRRHLDQYAATEQIRAWIHEMRTGVGCVREPWQGPDAACMYCGRRRAEAA